MRGRREDTAIVNVGRDPLAHHGVVNTPVYHASTVVFPTLEQFRASRDLYYPGVRYGSTGTPTTFALEQAVCELEGGERSIAVGSGVCAITASLLSFVSHGDHVLVSDSVYGPTRRVCERVLVKFGVEVTFYDPLVGAQIAQQVRPNTKVVFVESPGSLTFEIQDVPAIAKAAHAAGAVVIADNTWATPLYFKPFEHGVDVSIQAVTKYICGHADVMGGVITMREPLYRQLRMTSFLLGGYPGPDDCYLALRGLRTLGVRLPRHAATALELARWLKTRPEVARVMHPALPDDPGHALWKRDFRGACGLFGIVLHPVSEQALAAMLDGMELFSMGASWGGYESLIMPATPDQLRTATKWDAPGPTLRIHAGLEAPEDLIEDLERGFERLARGTRSEE